jgi:hypothetical protein
MRKITSDGGAAMRGDLIGDENKLLALSDDRHGSWLSDSERCDFRENYLFMFFPYLFFFFFFFVKCYLFFFFFSFSLHLSFIIFSSLPLFLLIFFYPYPLILYFLGEESKTFMFILIPLFILTHHSPYYFFYCFFFQFQVLGFWKFINIKSTTTSEIVKNYKMVDRIVSKIYFLKNFEFFYVFENILKKKGKNMNYILNLYTD